MKAGQLLWLVALIATVVLVAYVWSGGITPVQQEVNTAQAAAAAAAGTMGDLYAARIYTTDRVGVATTSFLWTNSSTMMDTMRIAAEGTLRLVGSGPGLYFQETDQAPFRQDYGHWRIIADQNALFIENWERGQVNESEYAQQDEFLSFHRAPTPSRTFPIGDHIIQWNYDFLGQGVRDLTIAANRGGMTGVTGVAPRVLSLSTLDASSNQLVPALQIMPGGANPTVSIPNGSLRISGSSGGIQFYNRATNAPSSWLYSPTTGVTSIYSDVSKKDVFILRDTTSGTQLCLGSTCVTETQLKALLKLIGS
jgi:hypothetical protein